MDVTKIIKKNSVDQSKITRDDDDKKNLESGSTIFPRKLDSKRKSSKIERRGRKTKNSMKTRLSAVVTDETFYGQDGGKRKLKDIEVRSDNH